MVTVIKELGTDETDTPNTTYIKETMEGNLDVCNFSGSANLQLSKLDEFQLQDVNSNIIFQGEIRQAKNGDTNTYTGFDYGIEMGESPIRTNYENKTPLEIMEDAINNYTSLTFSNANVTTSRTIPLYPTKNKTVNNVMEDMHGILGTTHYTDKDKVTHIEYEGEETNSKILEVGLNCWVDSDGWTTDTDMICKGITVNGDSKTTTETAYLSGDGTSTEFELPKSFTGITVEYPVGTELTAYISDINTGDYLINKETGKIVFSSAPASGTDNIKYTITYDIEANYTIDSTTDNKHHKTITLKYLKEVEDCITYAENYKSAFENGVRECKLIYSGLDSTLFRANQSIKIIDNYHKVDGEYINDTFIIKEVERTFGGGSASLILTVGDSSSFVFDRDTEINSKITDLNETITSADIFNEGISSTEDTNINTTIETEVFIYSAEIPNETLIYDANRQFSNSSDIQKYKYIKGTEYLALFTEETE